MKPTKINTAAILLLSAMMIFSFTGCVKRLYEVDRVFYCNDDTVLSSFFEQRKPLSYLAENGLKIDYPSDYVGYLIVGDNCALYLTVDNGQLEYDYLYTMSLYYEDFMDKVQKGTSVYDVQKLDPGGDYTTLYMGSVGSIPTTHLTKDLKFITIEYEEDETNGELLVSAIHVEDCCC